MIDIERCGTPPGKLPFPFPPRFVVVQVGDLWLPVRAVAF